MRVSIALTLLAAAMAVVLPGALAFVPPAAVGRPRRVQQQVRPYASSPILTGSRRLRWIPRGKSRGSSTHPIPTLIHTGARRRPPRRGPAPALFLAHGRRVLARGSGGGCGQDQGACQHEQGKRSIKRGCVERFGRTWIIRFGPVLRVDRSRQFVCTCLPGPVRPTDQTPNPFLMPSGDAIHEGLQTLPPVRLLQHCRLHPPVTFLVLCCRLVKVIRPDRFILGRRIGWAQPEQSPSYPTKPTPLPPRAVDAEFETFDVLSDPLVREEIKKFSNWPTIPQCYIAGEFVGGSDILLELFESGEWVGVYVALWVV